ncbi:MAG: DUF4268 domain-containing protein [Salinispira sp.]
MPDTKDTEKGNNAIGKIEKIPLTEVWIHEERNFTPWLQENIDILSNEVGFELLNVEREQSTGNFMVDLLAQDSFNNTVVIENQLKKSDHDHLGKLITYLTAFKAKIAIWIVSDPRPEHAAAISWLNDSTDCDFYLLKLEAIQIEGSKPAPFFTQIIGPNEIANAVKESDSLREQLQYQFWEGLLGILKTKHNIFSNISPQKSNWISAASGKGGISYDYAVTKDSSRIRLTIDRGKGSDEENVKIFENLYEKKDEIEKTFGSALEWRNRKEIKACYIRKIYDKAGWGTETDKLPKIFETLAENMQKFMEAFQPHIEKLEL